MNRDLKKREILSTQRRIELLKKDSGIFKRNKLKTIGLGALTTILGRLYTSESSIHSNSRTALEVSGMSQL